MGAAVSAWAQRLRTGLREWRPPTPPLPDHLEGILRDGDPEWFARELAIAAAPPWDVWLFMLRRFSWLVDLFGRVEITGSIPEELRRGPLLLAANHVGDFDPFLIAVALHRLGVVPRIMATGGIMSAPVAGPLLERTGGIRVISRRAGGTVVTLSWARVAEISCRCTLSWTRWVTRVGNARRRCTRARSRSVTSP